MADLTTWPDLALMSHAEEALVDRIRPGTLLAGRYRLQEQVQADPDTALWRAQDLTLERSVAVRVLAATHPRVQDTLDAARRAALVDDPRLQRVLGVGVEAGSGYVVLEWVVGRDAASLAGQVDQAEAVRVVTEAAEALRTAAARQLHHGRISPGRLVVAPDGRVRVLGTAVDVAAVGPATPAAAARPELRDVRDLAGVLYALLTGRWPFGADEGLPAAPTDKGRPVAAGTLTGDVDPGLDALLAQAVGGGGPDTLDELVERLHGSRAALGAGASPRGGTGAGPAAAAQDREEDVDDDTDVLSPARPGTSSGTASVAGAAAAGAAGAAAGAGASSGAGAGAAPAGAGGTAAGTSAAGTSAAGAPAAAYPPPTRTAPVPTGPYAPAEDDGWDLLPVGDGWEDQDPDPGPGAWAEDEQAWDERWDSQGPFDDLAVGTPAAAGAPDVVPRARRTPARRPAGAGTGVAVVLLMGAFVVATLVWALDRVQDAPVAAPSPAPVTESVEPSPEPSAPAPEPSEAPVEDAPQVITPAGVQALDPQGDGEENDQDAPRAIDGDPASVWTTQRYNSQDFGGLKTGLGLALDLGEPRDVASVQVTAPGEGGTYEIRSAAGPSFDGSTVLATGGTGDGAVELSPETPVSTQYLLVWFTALPEYEGDWRGAVGEVQVQVR